MSGTSMATPHVAGVAALIKAVKPSATGAEIADILRDTARPLKDSAADPVPNNAYGHGCLDAQAALAKARGPIIKPTITVHLRTPIIACPPKTLVINQCPPPPSVFQQLCPPRTIKINECGLLVTRIPAICPPVTITRPPITVVCPPTTFPTTIRTVPTQPIHPQASESYRGAATGYDPYGVLGEAAASGDDAAGSTYQAGYEAGYAAAVAEVTEAMNASAAETEGAGEDVQAGPGDDVLRPYPRSLVYYCPRTVTEPSCFELRTVNIVRCGPFTVGTPWCPVEIPTWRRTIPTTPYQQPGPAGYGEDWGYDPYGQSPFQG
jgi:hypothetical protein